MSKDQAYNRMIASLTRSVMLLMSIAVIVFLFTSASDIISNNSSPETKIQTDNSFLMNAENASLDLKDS
ncbi:MAG: hypothetical protein ACSHW7_02625 [Patiriisocius sp.]|uniref:hypothetical protein n=1 Tax=Patiriisocius sp. TaxID=2822396 RepID=UPI003EFA491F